MPLIPPDVGLRMRQQTELLTQPITAVKEIPSDLPEMKAGQAFNARIQEVLPENTYRALVAGKSMTLSLPESVKAGDLLELVVVDRTPKTIIAQRAPQGGTPTPAELAAYPHATFSRAAQLVRALLPAEGKAPPAAALNRGQPLLAQPPQTGTELAPILGKAVTQSGLFYESHQAQWVAGKLSLASLLREPQGLRSSPQARIDAQTERPLLLANVRQGIQGQPPATSSPATQPAAQNTALPAAQTTGLPTTQTTGGLPTAPGPALPAAQTTGLPMAPSSAPPATQSAAQPIAQNAAQAGLQPLPGQLPGLPGQPPVPPGSVTPANLLAASPQAQPGQESTPPMGESNTVTDKAAATTQPKQMASLPQTESQPITPQQLATSLKETVEAQRQQISSHVNQPVTAASIPEELRSLVQQQLEAAGTQRLMWHGEVWPGQKMQWEIEWREQGGGNSEHDDTEPWATTLRLTTPRLGEVEAAIRLGAGGVHIALLTPLGASAADLRAGAPFLEQALASAGVPMLGFTVKQSPPPEPDVIGTANG